jgi:two-component system sensor histidine kinase RegB
LAHQWRKTRAPEQFEYVNRFDHDQLMIADATLRQTISNILDNALDASPRWVALEVTRQNGTLTITVYDRGTGFAPAMLAQLGKPYLSSKGRPGGGLGLFLVVNMARILGGSLRAHNRPQGGAAVIFSLPLSAVTPRDTCVGGAVLTGTAP